MQMYITHVSIFVYIMNNSMESNAVTYMINLFLIFTHYS